MSEKLKPCRCGNIPRLVHDDVGYYGDDWGFWLICPVCGYMSDKFNASEMAIAEWNRRAEVSHEQG